MKGILFKPASAARIFLEITNVRVEKLGDITAEDIVGEGVGILFEKWCKKMPPSWRNRTEWEGMQYTEWQLLWQKINKTYDPETWVFVYEFKKVERP